MPKKTFYAEELMLCGGYNNKGEPLRFLIGVPARSLTGQDFDGSGKCGGYTAEELIANGLYKPHAHAAPKKEE